MKHFSFLLGSGFSVPANYPTTSQLNQRLKKINETELHIHTDMSAWFLNGEVDRNSWSKKNEKIFVQKFLEFYNEQILEGKPFHYEDFYDFYFSLVQTEILDDKCQKFFDDYKEGTEVEYDHRTIIMNFSYTFIQLLSKLLYRWTEPVTTLRPYPPPFAEFLELLGELGKEHKIHVHSLNHDLLFEQLSHSETIGGEFSDGFEEIGSPFYGEHFHNDNIEDRTKAVLPVRLRKFTDEFSKKFCLYKLHGSVDNYEFNFENKEYSLIKIPYGVQKDNLKKEYINMEGRIDYYVDHSQIIPEFLSGTSSKILSYDRNSYYKPLFKHFVQNLKKSSKLIVIGYGFGDRKINEYLIDAFLTNELNRMVVIDIKKPLSNIMNYKNVRFIETSIENMTRKHIYEYLS
jgi:hypothetical protein